MIHKINLENAVRRASIIIMIKLPELLAPGGTLDAFKTAVLYGADAIYAGLPGFSMRARAKITTEEVKTGIELAHAAGRKVYLAFNLFAHDREYANMPRVSEIINYLNPDALIVSDPGVLMWVREHHPDIPIHISTQANICSAQSVKFWQNAGASLCVLAREVSHNEFVSIRRACAWRIRVGVCCRTLLRAGRQIVVRARNCAGGNMMLFCANANRELKCQLMKTNVARIL